MGAIDLSIRVKDNRYPINVTVGDVAKFTLYFNPGDPYVLRYAENIQSLEITGNSADAMLAFTEGLEKNLDAIFGDGAARTICRYDSAEHELLNALLDKVIAGYEDFKEKAEAAQTKAQAQAVIDAKKEAQPFIVPVS